MPDQLSSEFKETVRTRTDLVALVGETVSLSSRGGGREFVGLCPFHDDHDPSLRVYPDRQTYRCWSCNAGGDCFTWVMEQDRVGFREALEILARRARLEMPRGRGSAPSSAAVDKKTVLYEALQWARQEFHRALLEAPFAEKARRYLRETRRFSDGTIRQFQLGYSPASWDWIQERAQGRFSAEVLAAARLVSPVRQGAGYGDFFRGRVLFPICNERGQVVSFGGRVLPGEDESFGKYQNGPESPVYHKSRVLFGLHLAREAIKKQNTAIITEGYTDCITLRQAGIENVVATCGTALTDLQVLTIKRFARQVVLVYDGDEAGQAAADKAAARFLAQDLDLRVLTLPEGQDPADYLQAHSAESFLELAAQAPAVWEYKFAAARRKHGLGTIDARQRVIDDMLSLLAAAPQMSENIREGLLLANLSSRLQVSEVQVRQRYGEIRSRAARRPAGVPRAEADPEIERLLRGPLTADDRLECELLEVLFAAPQGAPFAKRTVPVEDLRHPRLRELLRICYQLTADGGPTFERILDAMEDIGLKRLAVWIDDQARQKDVRSRLSADTADADGCPRFLRRLIEQLTWRREEQSQGRIAIELSAQGDGAHRIDEASEEMLRQLTQFHQRRATRKAPV